MTVIAITLLFGCETTEDTGSMATWKSAPLADISGTCPTIDNSQSTQTFTSNGIERKFSLFFPSLPKRVCNRSSFSMD